MKINVVTSKKIIRGMVIVLICTAIILSVIYIFEAGLFTDTVATSIAAEKYPVIIIDAGHGGMDGGTSGKDGTLEKEINLNISLKLDEMLSSFGINTIMIRTEDKLINDDSAKTIRQRKVSDIKNRMKIIENNPNSLFISIHQNYYSNSKYSGTQVFYSKNNIESEALASIIQTRVTRLIQSENQREIKKSGTEIYLLYHAKSPAVMIECGFLSNKQECENLKNEEYQKAMAFSIMCGIFDYITAAEET